MSTEISGRRFFLLWDWGDLSKRREQEKKGCEAQRRVNSCDSCNEREEARLRLKLCMGCLGQTIDD